MASFRSHDSLRATSLPAHLSQVVEVVLPPYPAEVGLQTVGLVGDVPGVKSLAVVELPFEKL